MDRRPPVAEGLCLSLATPLRDAFEPPELYAAHRLTYLSLGGHQVESEATSLKLGLSVPGKEGEACGTPKVCSCSKRDTLSNSRSFMSMYCPVLTTSVGMGPWMETDSHLAPVEVQVMEAWL